MTRNKIIKNIIDNLEVGDTVGDNKIEIIEDTLYYLGDKWLNYDDIFDELFTQYNLGT